MNKELRALLQTHTPGLLMDIDHLARLSDFSFEPELYLLWVQVDRQVRGLGLQYSYWRNCKLLGFLNSLEFERIARPLIYVVQCLQA